MWEVGVRCADLRISDFRKERTCVARFVKCGLAFAGFAKCGLAFTCVCKVRTC